MRWHVRAAALTRRRCSHMRSQAQGAPRAGATAYRGPLDALTTIIRKARGSAPAALRWRQQLTLQRASVRSSQEGVVTLFKGFATVLPVAPAQALYMGGYQAFRRLQPGDPDSPAVQFGALVTCVSACGAAMLARCLRGAARQWAAWWRR
jgi:hypothetical protein